MDAFNPIAQYLDRIRERHELMSQQYAEFATDPGVDGLSELEQDLLHKMANVTLRLRTVTRQLRVAVERIAEIDELAHVCTPDVLACQLEGLLEDQELLNKLALPAVQELQEKGKYSRD